MLEAPATPPLHVSGDEEEMEIEEEDELLSYGIGRDADINGDSDEDGFQDV